MNFKVAVVGGAGHIGLPLSCYIQNNGIETLIVDKNLESLELNIAAFRHSLKKTSKKI